jgi:acyl-coenzyme A thioesterase 13
MRDQLRFISATATPKATVTFELTVVPSLCNRMNILHGGAAALIFDMCTTMAVAPISRADFWAFGGLSRTLSVTFLRPVSLGTVVVIECEVIQIGKRLGTFMILDLYIGKRLY